MRMVQDPRHALYGTLRARDRRETESRQGVSPLNVRTGEQVDMAKWSIGTALALVITSGLATAQGAETGDGGTSGAVTVVGMQWPVGLEKRVDAALATTDVQEERKLAIVEILEAAQLAERPLLVRRAGIDRAMREAMADATVDPARIEDLRRQQMATLDVQSRYRTVALRQVVGTLDGPDRATFIRNWMDGRR